MAARRNQHYIPPKRISVQTTGPTEPPSFNRREPYKDPLSELSLKRKSFQTDVVFGKIRPKGTITGPDMVVLESLSWAAR